ncbi:MAG: hypothetical protein ACXV4A_07210, partial [Actinomycetes bacterium]
LVVVLLASGLKLLDASTVAVVAALAAVVVLGPVLWASVYRTAAPEVAEGRGASGLARAAVTGRWSRPRAGKSSEDRSTAG